VQSKTSEGYSLPSSASFALNPIRATNFFLAYIRITTLDRNSLMIMR
jgi:hypothetical protein